ncbi:MAG: hypothetical protein WDN00_00420 [Limisphaerales bacterium]
MKNQTENLKAALEKRVKLVLEIKDMERRTRNIADQISDLEMTCDLDDPAALGKITQLQVLVGFLPRRIDNREQALDKFDVQLLDDCHEFITKHGGPRLRDLVTRAKAKVTAKLQSNFSDEADLEQAVSKSSLVAEIERIQAGVTIYHHQSDKVITYASVLIQAWKDADAFEAKLA